MSKNPLDALPGNLGNNLGEYLREQRLLARLSVRQLSALAGVSNPYLSQIERGVKRPSADILQQIAKGLSISAETLYVQAGLLDPTETAAESSATTRSAIRSDQALTARQRQTLLEIYDSFVGVEPSRAKGASSPSAKGARAGAGPAGSTGGKGAAKRSTTASAPPRTKPAASRSTKKKTTSPKGSPTASGSTTSKSTPRRTS